MTNEVIIRILENQISVSKSGIVEITDNLSLDIINNLRTLEKALDKACVLLTKWEVDDTHEEKYWKEWFLKDE